jgi:hypothetical protein
MGFRTEKANGDQFWTLTCLECRRPDDSRHDEKGNDKMGSGIVERKNEKIEPEYDKGIRDGFQHIVTREMAEYEQ